MEAQKSAFLKLKPRCVGLSQAILVFSSRRANGNEVVDSLADLLATLRNVTTTGNALDQKLADYVFFPLSQALKSSQTLPLQALELSLQCLAILLEKGWREHIPASLSSQLVILLTFMGDKSQKIPQAAGITDDLQKAALLCLSNLFASLHLTPAGRASLIETGNIPSLGHAVTVILDGIVDGSSTQTQLTAAQALHSLLQCLIDPDVAVNFLPGIVSKLSKALTPSTETRRHWKVLRESIQILRDLFRLTVSDSATVNLAKATTLASQETARTGRDNAWLQATSGQLKVALASINRLHSHGRPEVRAALLDLNIMILSECKTSLKNCCQLVLETALVLVEDDEDQATRHRLVSTVRVEPTVANQLQTTFHDWSVSLSRIMQSNDQALRERRMRQVFMAFGVLSECEVDVRLPYRILSGALRDSVTIIVQPPRGERKTIQDMSVSLSVQGLPTLQNGQHALSFPSQFSGYTSQDALLALVASQITTLSRESSVSRLGTDLAASLHASQGDSQVATFWLLLTVLNAATSQSDDISTFLTLDDIPNGSLEAAHEELYAFSVAVMEDGDSDWRLKNLALEAVASQARCQGLEFRSELIDCLYPVLHHLGASVPQVRNHAIICLNIVSEACGYASVRDMVVENVDYLVNAVALKLNAFDVSPQGPQVLLMMVRLAGPSLLPYLEDTIESIFAALEDYHGYPALVELLFAVLKTMVDEGVKAPMLAITGHEQDVQPGTINTGLTSMDELLASIRLIAQKQQESQLRTDDSSTSFPQQPWKTSDPLAQTPTAEHEAEDQEAEEEPPDETKTPPPTTKTYSLLLKITQMTQHHLASSSPSLRTSLLALLGTAMPALGRHEDSFLPLVNTLWPELVSRLQDSETHIVAASLDTVAVMCRHAGRFMHTRIQALWPDLLALHRRVSGLAKSETGRRASQALAARGTGIALTSEYIDTSDRALRRSFECLLAVIVSKVGVDAEMFDEVLRMLQPLKALSAESLAVLEEHNADAVWLARCHATKSIPQPTPTMLSSPWTFVKVGA